MSEARSWDANGSPIFDNINSHFDILLTDPSPADNIPRDWEVDLAILETIAPDLRAKGDFDAAKEILECIDDLRSLMAEQNPTVR